MKSLVPRLLLALQLAAPAQFIDVSQQAGLTHSMICGSHDHKTQLIETLGSGLAFIDYDNDGYLDLFTVTASTLDPATNPAPTNHLYRNLHNGKFQDVTEAAGLAHSGWGQGVCAGDFDNDGFTDLFVTYYGQDVLYRNTGKGGFQNVTKTAGLSDRQASPPRWGTGCAFLDYNLDGKLDLFVSNYVQFDPKTTPNACRWKNQPVLCGPLGLKGGHNRLWRNASVPGSIRFDDVSAQAGILNPGERYSLSATTIDYDRDGWPDIYVAVDSQAAIFYHNNRDGTFTDRAMESGVALSEEGVAQAGMGTATADFDGDGHLDLAKTNFVDDLPNLYRNLGDGSFEESTIASGLGRHREFMGWGIAFLDFDNDTWPDLFMVNGHIYPNVKGLQYKQRRLLYKNLGNRKFLEVTDSAGGELTTQKSSRGLAVGDFDNDGNVDVVISNLNDPPTLLRNSGGTHNHFLNILLIGTQANRSAIGARVTVKVPGRILVQEIRSGSSFLSQSDLRLHFGLGPVAKIDRLEIDWPGGSTQIVDGVEADRFLTVKEDRQSHRAQLQPVAVPIR